MLNYTKLLLPLLICSTLFISLASFSAASSDTSQAPSSCDNNDFVNTELAELYNSIQRYYDDNITACQKMLQLRESHLLPSIDFEQFQYLGGFRVPFDTLNSSADPYQSLDFSYGIITYNPEKDSLFISGNPSMGSVAELAIPELVRSFDYGDFNKASKSIQPLKVFHRHKDANSIQLTGIDTFFRITGLGLIGNSLIVNYINWYDAEGTETDTTIVFKNASDIEQSDVLGPYQLTGGAHSAGWMSPIPKRWRGFFRGSYIFGNQSGASINSRLSIGPTAFSIYPGVDILRKKNGKVPAQALLDFPMPNILHDSNKYNMPEDLAKALKNDDLNNHLWTNLSGTSYGFIVPGTRTYMTLGRSGGHNSGVGYKIIQSNGNQCDGSCPHDFKDVYSYYWAWDVFDLLKVRYGLIQAHQVRPTSHGKINVPVNTNAQISGGTFDFKNNRLFLSFKNGDTINKYGRPPLILVFKLKTHRISL